MPTGAPALKSHRAFASLPPMQVAVDSGSRSVWGLGTATQQLLIRLPEELARRLKRQVPARGRSAFVQRLLEHVLALEGGEDDPLHQAALKVEQDERLAAEMAEWDNMATDGLKADASKA